MTQGTRTFRVFVSSTFRDLVAERNALAARVFPKLRELAAKHGCRFQAIDLRWGVPAEAGLDHRAMRICLDELARCQEVSPRPNFLILLGDRYGWRPAPAEIPADEFERLRARIADKTDLDTWYKRDDNAVPPVYVLQPRTGQFEADKEWEPVEQRLRRALLAAAEAEGLPELARLKYAASATEQEIRAGALAVPDAHEHVFAFFREIEGAAGEPFGEPDEDARRRQEVLKAGLWDWLRGDEGRNVARYKAKWTGQGITTDHLDALCKDVEARLSEVIEREATRLEKIEPVEAEAKAHEQFGERRARVFIGREEPLDRIDAYARGTDRRPLAVWGESGCGKSALVAKAIERATAAQPEAVICRRFIGATAASSDIRSLLEGICREVSRAYGDETPVPAEYRELVAEWPKRLGLATAARPLIVFLDALDQLSPADGAHGLTWLPRELPEHARVVVSTLPGPCLRALEAKLPESNRVELRPMTPAEGRELLARWLQGARRRLTPTQEGDVLTKFDGCGLPLYLKLAFEEARRWRSYEGLPKGADDVPGLFPDIPGVLRDLFARLSEPRNHGPLLVSHALGYLAAARNGLTEDELVDVLSADEELMKPLAARWELPERRLPVVIWSRLYADLEAYLTVRSADGASVMAFYHRQVGEAAAAEYLKEEDERARHAGLAAYFGGQPAWREEAGGRQPNRRKASELAYQQSRGEMWQDLEKTLADPDFIRAVNALGRGFDFQADLNASLVDKHHRSRTFRVYVCSTFNDFTAERDALERHAFPHLREYCRRRGGAFLPVDLRYGITEQDASDHSMLTLNLDEIERCQRTTPRPNFILLLGQCLGWHPLPSEIPADEFERIERAVTRTSDRELLQGWYLLDGNAVPPVYCLLGRQGQFSDWRNWAPVERALRSILLDATSDLPREVRRKYTSSAIEQEVLHGVLREPSAQQNALCFLRTIRGLPLDASARSFIDVDADGQPSADAGRQLSDLKDRLRDALPRNVHEYQAEWTGSGITTSHLERLCRDVIHSLSAVIDQETMRARGVDALEEEVSAHEAFARERAHYFIGRTGIFRQIADYVAGSDPRPLVVFGPAGSGKSALMARAEEFVRGTYPHALVIYRSIGLTPASSDSRSVLETLCHQMQRIHGVDDRTAPVQYGRLLEETARLLALAHDQRPLVLFLDGLDRFAEGDQGRDLLWLPGSLPQHVRAVVSTRPGESLSLLEQRLAGENLLELGPMPVEDGRELMAAWLRDARRTLQAPQWEAAMRRFSRDRLPANLRIAFEEAVNWKSHTPVDVSSGAAPIDSARELLARLEATRPHCRVLVRRCLSYLAASRYGLAEDELLDVLWADEEVVGEMTGHASNPSGLDRLPFIMWSRLLRELRPHIFDRFVDGTSVLSVHHSLVEEAVRAEYLRDASRREIHDRLARYFIGLPLIVETHRGSLPNKRKLLELAYQMIQANPG